MAWTFVKTLYDQTRTSHSDSLGDEITFPGGGRRRLLYKDTTVPLTEARLATLEANSAFNVGTAHPHKSDLLIKRVEVAPLGSSDAGSYALVTLDYQTLPPGF